MMDSDEPNPNIEPSDDESINLIRMSGSEIIKLAKGKYGKRDGGDRSNWSKLLDEFGEFIVIAILMGPILVDTLFLYVPIINENIKCLALDDKLKIIAMVLRSFTDLPFLLDLLRYDATPKSRMFNILALLPIPQREIDCWISTCRSENGCNLSTLQCDNTPFKNVTILNDLCPTNPPNPMAYDFGIFVDSLQSGIVGTTDFPQKLLMCLSWGLRNLSSFASNLNSSTNAWESVFVISISISGLLLFIYLLGHVQTFMQAITRTSQIWQRMPVIYPRIQFMLSEYGLQEGVEYASWIEGVEYAIMKLVGEALEEDEGLAAENIFSLLPRELQRRLKCHLFLATLKKLPGLENKDRQVLDAIMKDLKPVSYADGTYIIREGEPLDRMLFITQGIALAYKTGTTGGESGSSSTTPIAKGEVYGEELMAWAATSTQFSGLPISDQTVKSLLSGLPISGQTVKSYGEVEVFAIRATRLKRIVSEFSTHFNTEVITTV